jgi:hypothetical protein
MEGEDLGKVKEIMLDVNSGCVSYVVLAHGGILGMGEKLFAVPWQAMTLDMPNHEFVLDMTRERFENAPGFDPSDWPDFSSEDWGRSVYSYYQLDYPSWMSGGMAGAGTGTGYASGTGYAASTGTGYTSGTATSGSMGTSSEGSYTSSQSSFGTGETYGSDFDRDRMPGESMTGEGDIGMGADPDRKTGFEGETTFDHPETSSEFDTTRGDFESGRSQFETGIGSRFGTEGSADCDNPGLTEEERRLCEEDRSRRAA